MARKLGLRQGDDIEQWALAHGVPSLKMTSSKDPSVGAALRRIAPDLICISTFRWLLRRDILSTARHGAINLISTPPCSRGTAARSPSSGSTTATIARRA